MKKLIVLILFVTLSFLIYSYGFKSNQQDTLTVYSFDFETLDKTFWTTGYWDDLSRQNDAVALDGGVLKVGVDPRLGAGYLLSKPIPIREGDVITLKRRVRISSGDDMFNGGLAMFQTSDENLIPQASSGPWVRSFGDGVFLVEYSRDLLSVQDRPGRDVIRFLAADWEYNNNYQLITPIYDRWYDETITFDTRSSQMTYSIDGKTYRLNSYQLDRSYIRFFMHAYGEGVGHLLEVDSLEITVEYKKAKR